MRDKAGFNPNFSDIRWETVFEKNPLGVFRPVLFEEISPRNRAFLFKISFKRFLI
jgi:hypothetical protein